MIIRFLKNGVLKRVTAVVMSVVVLVVVAGCAASPDVVEVKQKHDQFLNCQQLKQEIARAESYKRKAREDDEFQFRYLMVTTALMSMWNMNQAESRAQERIEHLTSIFNAKNCHQQMQGSHQQYQHYQQQPQWQGVQGYGSYPNPAYQQHVPQQAPQQPGGSGEVPSSVPYYYIDR